MKILFLSGFPLRKDTYGAFYNLAPISFNYGQLCLAAVLEKHGFEDLNYLDIEMDVGNKSRIIPEIKKYEPDVIAISAYSLGIDSIYELLKSIRESMPGVILVAGGPHVTLYPEDLIRRSLADFCMIGESDLSFHKLIEALENNTGTSNIPNLVYREGDTIVRNSAVDHIDNLDILPYPAMHLVKHNLHKYHPQYMVYRKRPVLDIVTSRGCPFSCKFCSGTKLWTNGWHANSPEYVVKMMQYYIEAFGIREFTFHEASFLVDKKRVLDICKLIMASDLKISWSAEINLRTIDEEIASNMRNAGCWLVSAGIESGDDNILRSIDKPLTVGEARKNASILKQCGLKIRGYFMLGFFDETKETLAATIDFSKELPLYSANYSIFVPDPGSTLFNMINSQSENGINYDINTYKTNSSDRMYHPEGLTGEYLMKMQKKAFLQFFIRPRQILILIKELRSLEDLYRYSCMLFGSLVLLFNQIKTGFLLRYLTRRDT